MSEEGTPEKIPMISEAEEAAAAGEKNENPETESQMGSEKSDSSCSIDDRSPRSVLEIPISGAEALSLGSNRLRWKCFINVLRKKSMRRLSTFPPSDVSRRSLNRKLAQIRWSEEGLHDGEAAEIRKPSWRSFNYEELAAATNNFSSENLIGKGGHAEVYKGSLAGGQVVAVKRLRRKEKEEEKDRVGDFLSELGIIAHINHPNAARLLGFGVEGGLHLVLQYSPHGSLVSLLHGCKECLEWRVRFKVALGVAEGLQYLHQGCHRRIIHRDIKASNILFTQDYEPQISDFGLAKWLPDQWTHHIVFPIEGTFGYLAPEYFMHGIVDEKTDVFAFGVLLLELITGRRAVDSCRQSLVIWAKPFLETKNVKELADPRLSDAYDLLEMKRMISTASMCINHVATTRPHMSRVVQLLKGEDGLSEVKAPVAVKALLLDAFDLEDYTRSNYLTDLDRYKQLALE